MSDHQKTVVGFIHRVQAEIFPCALVTVVKSDDTYYGVWMNGEHRKMVYPGTLAATLEDITLRKSFMAYAGNKTASDFKLLTSFALSAQEIEIGSTKDIAEVLRRESINTQRPQEDRNILADSYDIVLKFQTGSPRP